VKLSIIEIYKEGIYDLLCPETKTTDLKIKEHPKKGIYVQNLHEEYVGDRNEVLVLLTEAERFRVVAETMLNKSSSRSHLLLMLDITQKLPDGIEKRGILNLVDLAGSEKISKSGAVGETLEEAKKINLSLSTLGNVISALTTLNKEYVPYRDSKLTRILQDSLGGNYKTTLIVTCSPHVYHYEETLSTLKFAQRAKKIKNTAKINIKRSNEELENLVSKLNKELKLAKQELAKLRGFTNETTPTILSPKHMELSTIEIVDYDRKENIISKNIDSIEAKLKDEEIKILKRDIEALKEENEELKNKVETLSKEQQLDGYIKRLENLLKTNINEFNVLKENLTVRQDEGLLSENAKLKQTISELNKKYLKDIKSVRNFSDLADEDVDMDYFNKAIDDSDVISNFNFQKGGPKDSYLNNLDDLEESYRDIFEYKKSFLAKIHMDFNSTRDYFKTLKVGLSETKLNSEIQQRNKTNKLKNSFIHLNLTVMFYEKLLYDVLNKVLLDNKKYKLIEQSNKELYDKLDGFNVLFSSYMELLNEFKNIRAESAVAAPRDSPIQMYRGNVVRPVSKRSKTRIHDLSSKKSLIELVAASHKNSFVGGVIQEVGENEPNIEEISADDHPKFDMDQVRRMSTQANNIRNRKKATGPAEINDDLFRSILNRQNTAGDTPELKYLLADLNLYKNFLNIVMIENKTLKQKQIDTNEIVKSFQDNYRNIYEQEITNYSGVVEILRVINYA
jgi:hypothetical protein